MNRPTIPAPVPSGAATTQAANGPVHEQLSALVDGELEVGAATVLWQQDDAGGDELCATWARYHLIGDALRGTTSQAVDGARVSAIMRRVRDERLAASVAAVTPAQVVVASPHRGGQRRGVPLEDVGGVCFIGRCGGRGVEHVGHGCLGCCRWPAIGSSTRSGGTSGGGQCGAGRASAGAGAARANPSRSAVGRADGGTPPSGWHVGFADASRVLAQRCV